MRPKCLDLFSGIGGFSLAFERQGFSTIAQVEKDKNCLKLLESKWPAVMRHNDVTSFDTDSIECPSVVTFGSPCQDLSVAGQRQGMAGERSGLFYHATRIIQRLVGRGLEFALWENVEGAFSSNGGRDFAGVLAELGRCGALEVGWRILDAQYFSLAQRRRRVFVVADFRARRVAEVLSLIEGMSWYPAPSREAGQRIAPSVSTGAPFGRTGNSRVEADAMISCADGTLSSRNNADRGDSGHLSHLIPSVANPCGGHHTRNDLDNDTYIPCVARAVTAERDGYNDGSDQTYLVMASGQANAEVRSDGSPSLTCQHDGPPIVIPIQSVNMVREKKQNGIGIGQPGEACYTLTGRDQHAIAFSTKDHGQDAALELSPTLRSGNHIDGNANGGCGPAIAFQSRIARNGHGVPSCAVSALQASATGDSKPLVAFAQNTRDEVREMKVAGALPAQPGMKQQTYLNGNFGVRRLTPRECERLQGFPDDYTAGFSDSVRYRMLGNSVAVPVVEWLAKAMRAVIP